MINNLEHKIHILIPFFNADNFLKECIDSILSQNYKNYICYLYDDGSTDNSKNIGHDYIKNYGNKFIYLHNQSNLGPAGSKYYGLKYIEKNSFANDIILIIDGDDYLINNALQIINQKYLDTKCWFTYGSCNGKWCEQGDYPPKNNFR